MQPEAVQARMTLAPEHDVIVDQDAQFLGRRGDALGHRHIVLEGRGMAGVMVVQQTTLPSTELLLLVFFRQPIDAVVRSRPIAFDSGLRRIPAARRLNGDDLSQCLSHRRS